MRAFGRKAEALCRWIAWLILAVMLAQAGPALAQTCPPVEVRAMTYNIRLDLASDGPNAWPHRRGELIGQIQIVRPDIVGMQEVLPGQRREIAGALAGYDFVGVARDDGRDAGEYSPLGVRRDAFEIAASGTFWLSPTPDRPSKGWDAAYNRIATWARLRHRRTGLPVLALNTHWDHVGTEARRQSAALIVGWLARNRKAGERLLVMGDFNARLSEDSMQALTQGGLRDTRASAASKLGPEVTFNAFQAIPPPAEAIDHILVGEGWSVRRHAVIAQHVDGRVISDHFPVVADLAAAREGCRR